MSKAGYDGCVFQDLESAQKRIAELEAQVEHVRASYETFDEECDLPELRQAIAVALGLKPAEGT